MVVFYVHARERIVFLADKQLLLDSKAAIVFFLFKVLQKQGCHSSNNYSLLEIF